MPNLTQTRFLSNIIKLNHKEDYSQTLFAEFIGFSPSHVSMILNRKVKNISAKFVEYTLDIAYPELSAEYIFRGNYIPRKKPEKKEYISFGAIINRIRIFMYSKSWNQSQLASKLHLSPSFVSQNLNEKNENPSAKIIFRLLDFFPELSADWLIRGEGTMFLLSSRAVEKKKETWTTIDKKEIPITLSLN